MGFKLGKSTDTLFNSIKDSDEEANKESAPIIRKKLEGGVQGEANKDGTIFIDPSVDLNSEEGRNILAHENAHIDQFNTLWDTKSGKIAKEENENTVALFDYDKKSIWWKGKETIRKDITEGLGSHDWEKDAEERVNSLYNKTKTKNEYYG